MREREGMILVADTRTDRPTGKPKMSMKNHESKSKKNEEGKGEDCEEREKLLGFGAMKWPSAERKKRRIRSCSAERVCHR